MTTDLIKITDKEIKILSSFPAGFKNVFFHEDRVLCDNFVYGLNNQYNLIQTLDHDFRLCIN